MRLPPANLPDRAVLARRGLARLSEPPAAAGRRASTAGKASTMQALLATPAPVAMGGHDGLVLTRRLVARTEPGADAGRTARAGAVRPKRPRNSKHRHSAGVRPPGLRSISAEPALRRPCRPLALSCVAHRTGAASTLQSPALQCAHPGLEPLAALRPCGSVWARSVRTPQRLVLGVLRVRRLKLLRPVGQRMETRHTAGREHRMASGQRDGANAWAASDLPLR